MQTAALERPALGMDDEIRAAVKTIIRRVQEDGDAALAAMTEEFDGVRLASFVVDEDEKQAAVESLDKEALAAIDTAIANVRTFHSAQHPVAVSVETAPGVLCERIARPIDAVGLYVPAGTAPLPSAAIMLAVPAAIAACPVRVLCTPPRKDGRADPAVVAAATRAGVDTLLKVGGAQAIAALAYGTASVPRVHKIFGPGNAWVTCAKSLVSSDPRGAAIDMPAGPSEVLVIADARANPVFVAADLLSQAEHGADSQVILLTDSEELAQQVQRELAEQLLKLTRRETVLSSLQHARILLVSSLAEAIALSNRYAPEHLILQCENARTWVDKVTNAGSVFVGAWTPESVGDYCSGTNHVLPTYGYARNYSGLGVDQFMRQMTVQELTRSGLEGLAPTVKVLAGLEGLDAHAAAVNLRLADKR